MFEEGAIFHLMLDAQDNTNAGISSAIKHLMEYQAALEEAGGTTGAGDQLAQMGVGLQKATEGAARLRDAMRGAESAARLFTIPTAVNASINQSIEGTSRLQAGFEAAAREASKLGASVRGMGMPRSDVGLGGMSAGSRDAAGSAVRMASIQAQMAAEAERLARDPTVARGGKWDQASYALAQAEEMTRQAVLAREGAAAGAHVARNTRPMMSMYEYMPGAIDQYEAAADAATRMRAATVMGSVSPGNMTSIAGQQNMSITAQRLEGMMQDASSLRGGIVGERTTPLGSITQLEPVVAKLKTDIASLSFSQLNNQGSQLNATLQQAGRAVTTLEARMGKASSVTGTAQDLQQAQASATRLQTTLTKIAQSPIAKPFMDIRTTLGGIAPGVVGLNAHMQQTATINMNQHSASLLDTVKLLMSSTDALHIALAAVAGISLARIMPPLITQIRAAMPMILIVGSLLASSFASGVARAITSLTMLQQRMRDIFVNSAFAASIFDNIEAAITRLRASIAGLRSAVGTSMSFVASSIRSAFTAPISYALERLERLHTGFSNVKSMAASMLLGGLGYTAVTEAFHGMEDFGSEMIKIGMTTENLRVQLQQMYQVIGTGGTVLTDKASMFIDQKKADQALLWINQYARSAPFSLDQIRQSASFINSIGGNITSMIPVLSNLAGVANTTIGQAGQAVVNAYEGRWQMMQRQLKITKEMLIPYGLQVDSSGHADQATFLSALQAFQVARFPHGSEQASKTMTGILSNLKDQFMLFAEQTSMGNLTGVADPNSLYAEIKNRLNDLQKFLWSDKGTAALKKAASEISGFLKGLVSGIYNAAGVVETYLPAAFHFVTGVMSLEHQLMAKIWGQMQQPIAQFINWFRTTVPPIVRDALNGVGKFWQEHQGQIKTALQGALNIINDAIHWIHDHWGDLWKVVVGVFDIALGLIQSGMAMGRDILKNSFGTWQKDVMTGGNKILLGFVNVAGSIAKAFVPLEGQLSQIWTNVAQGFRLFATGPLLSFISAFINAGKYIAMGLEPIFGILNGLINANNRILEIFHNVSPTMNYADFQKSKLGQMEIADLTQNAPFYQVNATPAQRQAQMNAYIAQQLPQLYQQYKTSNDARMASLGEMPNIQFTQPGDAAQQAIDAYKKLFSTWGIGPNQKITFGNDTADKIQKTMDTFNRTYGLIVPTEGIGGGGGVKPGEYQWGTQSVAAITALMNQVMTDVTAKHPSIFGSDGKNQVVPIPAYIPGLTGPPPGQDLTAQRRAATAAQATANAQVQAAMGAGLTFTQRGTVPQLLSTITNYLAAERRKLDPQGTGVADARLAADRTRLLTKLETTEESWFHHDVTLGVKSTQLQQDLVNVGLVMRAQGVKDTVIAEHLVQLAGAGHLKLVNMDLNLGKISRPQANAGVGKLSTSFMSTQIQFGSLGRTDPTHGMVGQLENTVAQLQMSNQELRQQNQHLLALLQTNRESTGHLASIDQKTAAATPVARSGRGPKDRAVAYVSR